MAAISAEQLQMLIDALIARTEAVPAPPGLRGGHQGHVIAKNMRCEDFAGGAWADWAFAFKRGVRAQNPEAFRTMQAVEAASVEFQEATELAHELEVTSGELYDVLCQFCRGEALSIVKSASDMRGFEAWQKLHAKYNPRTMARAVRMLGEVVGPARVKELADIQTAVNRWEEKVRILNSQFDEELSNNMKIAIFTNMLPLQIQDHVYTVANKDTKYEELRDKVQAFVGNKIAVNMGPAPMDVGVVDKDANESQAYDQQYDEEEWQVDAVGYNTKCYRCGGYGHLAKDCATAKGQEKGGMRGPGGKGADGKGKGNFGGNFGNFGKGDGKGSYGKGKDGGKGGKGKGYQGTCWKCGKVGHKAAECRMAGAIDTEEGNENCEDCCNVEMGGVWVIGNIEAKKDPVRLSNKFQALQVDDGEALEYPDLRPPEAVKEELQGRSLMDPRSAETAPPPPAGDVRRRRRRKLVAAFGGGGSRGGKCPCEGWPHLCTSQDMHASDSRDEIVHGQYRAGHGGEWRRAQHGRSPELRGGRGAASYEEEEDEVQVASIDSKEWTRVGGMKFNVADVKKPLAAAAKVVEAGNRIVLDPDPNKSFIENVETKERMRVKKEKGVYIIEVKYEDGGEGKITLDSGAGVSVWPRSMKADVKMTPKVKGLKMIAANGTEIENFGQKVIKFQGEKCAEEGFRRRS